MSVLVCVCPCDCVCVRVGVSVYVYALSSTGSDRKLSNQEVKFSIYIYLDQLHNNSASDAASTDKPSDFAKRQK